jgi:hypothetical protein
VLKFKRKFRLQRANADSNVLALFLDMIISLTVRELGWADKRKYTERYRIDNTVTSHIKGKGHPITGHQGPRGGSRGIALLILNLGARRGGWSAPRPGRFTPGKDSVQIV